METINTLTINSMIEVTAANVKAALQHLNYTTTLTEEHSILIESNDKNIPSTHMFNIRTNSKGSCEHRQRFIIISELNGKLINRITYYDATKACKHLIECTIDLV